MKQYILGRDGTQLFKIPENRIRVSHRHAKLTVNDDGRWILEDLNSGNGTYIITDDGELMKVNQLKKHLNRARFDKDNDVDVPQLTQLIEQNLVQTEAKK